MSLIFFQWFFRKVICQLYFYYCAAMGLFPWLVFWDAPRFCFQQFHCRVPHVWFSLACLKLPAVLTSVCLYISLVEENSWISLPILFLPHFPSSSLSHLGPWLLNINYWSPFFTRLFFSHFTVSEYKHNWLWYVGFISYKFTEFIN